MNKTRNHTIVTFHELQQWPFLCKQCNYSSSVGALWHLRLEVVLSFTSAFLYQSKIQCLFLEPTHDCICLKIEESWETLVKTP